MLALSEIATKAFIRSIGTVFNVVANRSKINAAPGNSGAGPLSMRTPQRWSNAGMLSTLIRSISTVVLTVADVRFVNALGVLTLVEVIRTCDLSAVLFIRVILAVVRSIAVPRDGDANSGRLTPEVLLQIALVRFHRRTAEFITSIVTIRYTIALVGLFNALP